MDIETGRFLATVQFGPETVFFFEDWDSAPAGKYAAIMRFYPDGSRTVYGSTESGIEYLSTVHKADNSKSAKIMSKMTDREWLIGIDSDDGSNIDIKLELDDSGIYKILNRILGITPKGVHFNRLAQVLTPVLLAPLLGTDPGQRMAGTTETGADITFVMKKMYAVKSGTCFIDGIDMGPLCPCSFAHDMGDFHTIPKPMASIIEMYLERPKAS